MLAEKQRRQRQVIGYVLVGIVVVGLIYLVYWLITENPKARFRGIERLRGEAPTQVLDSAMCARQAMWFSHDNVRGADADRVLRRLFPAMPPMPGGAETASQAN